jgi:hypothetical protein
MYSHTRLSVLVISGAILLLGLAFGAIAVDAMAKKRLSDRVLREFSEVHRICNALEGFEDGHEGRMPAGDEFSALLNGLEDPVESSWVLNAALVGQSINDLAPSNNPSRTVLVFECSNALSTIGSRSLLPALPRHGKDIGYVMAFADFHIEIVSIEEVDRLIWNPASRSPERDDSADPNHP